MHIVKVSLLSGRGCEGRTKMRGGSSNRSAATSRHCIGTTPPERLELCQVSSVN